MARAEVGTVINRPIADVFAVVSDPESSPKWSSGSLESTKPPGQWVLAEPGGFFKLAEPLVVSIAKRQFQSDFDNLKELMEANAL